MEMTDNRRRTTVWVYIKNPVNPVNPVQILYNPPMHNELKRGVKMLAEMLSDELEAVFWLNGTVVTQLGVALTKDAGTWPGLLLVMAGLPQLRQLDVVAQWEAETAVSLPIACVSRTILPGYLQANPMLAACWSQTAHLLWGDSTVVGTLPADMDGAMAAADAAAQLYELSLLLAPTLLSAGELAVLRGRLGEQPADAALDYLATHCDQLNQQLDQLPADLWPSANPVSPADAPLPGLHALYKTEQGRVVLVFDALDGKLLRETDWAALVAGLGSDCTGLQVATVRQLQLVLARETPLDVVFRRYGLDWGGEVVTAVHPHPAHILRQATRLPLHILVERLPQACINATDETKRHRIIHDYQNKLLNVQLEHEILTRLGHIPRFVPAPLPERDAPLAERIDAIFNQLHRWVSFYLTQLAAAES